MKTNITIILDRSGSMQSIRTDTEGGFNAFIEEQKKVEGEAEVTLIQFDSQYEVVYKNRNIQDVPALVLAPRGPTALYDAICRTINQTHTDNKNICTSCKTDKNIFVVITDGFENASREFHSGNVKDLISHAQKEHDWQFVFIGANQDAVLTGSNFNITKGYSLNYTSTPEGARKMFDTLSRSMSTYRCSTQAPDEFFDKKV